MVYLSESSGYIPVTSLRNRPIAPNYHPSADLETWQADPWDRDYNRRLRFNNTRVQRKFNIEMHYNVNNNNFVFLRYRSRVSRRLYENKNWF